MSIRKLVTSKGSDPMDAEARRGLGLAIPK